MTVTKTELFKFGQYILNTQPEVLSTYIKYHAPAQALWLTPDKLTQFLNYIKESPPSINSPNFTLVTNYLQSVEDLYKHNKLILEPNISLQPLTDSLRKDLYSDCRQLNKILNALSILCPTLPIPNHYDNDIHSVRDCKTAERDDYLSFINNLLTSILPQALRMNYMHPEYDKELSYLTNNLSILTDNHPLSHMFSPKQYCIKHINQDCNEYPSPTNNPYSNLDWSL